MNNSSLKNAFLVVIVALVSACGGGGSSSGGSTDNENDGSASLNPPKVFSVSLDQVVVKRISNGDSINVDTEGVNSGTLVFQD